MDILFLAHRAPFPPDRGDKIRSFHILRHLMSRARVHLIAFGEQDADFEVPADIATALASATLIHRRKPQAMAAVEALARRLPVSLTAFDSAAMRAAVAATMARYPIDAVYCFSGQMAQYMRDDIPFIMDFVDLDSAKFASFAEQGNRVMRGMMRREARLLGAFERRIAARAKASLFVSEAEADLFRANDRTGRVLAVENGIDATVFDPDRAQPVSTTTGPLIVFTGQMDYRPNIDGVSWFARQVLPALRERHPSARFAIVGRAPTAGVQALAGDNVIVTGAVDDVRPWLAAANVCVAPLHLARGIQNKVLEAMAMARPVVASVAAAEGIDHGGTLRIADGVAEHVAAIDALIADPVAAAALGRTARARVLARYDWHAQLKPLDALLGLA